ncbi:MAG: hypothetical protein CMO01_12745 [Thalassobius sp.]|nr:hypothetical protein [Thalassovita sp.]
MNLENWTRKLLFFCLILLCACDKEDFTDPADLNCYFTLTADAPINGNLSVESVIINLSGIDINGDHTNENKTLRFERNFSGDDGQFSLIGSDASQPVNIQIPQGIYSSLQFDLNLREDEFEFELDADDDDETNNLTEYVQRANPGILLIGTYTSEGESLKIVFSVDDDLSRIRTNAEQNGESTIVLEKLTPSTATFNFDVDYWFGLVTNQMIQNAARLELDGEPAVFIYEDFNENLFSTVVSRIEASTQLTITTD